MRFLGCIITILLAGVIFQSEPLQGNSGITQCNGGPPSSPPQSEGTALPVVTVAEVPSYPAVARVAEVQGDVRIRITTDGQRIINTRVESGTGSLAMSAEGNVKTWRFAQHKPTEFLVTYRFRLVPQLQSNPDNPVIMLRLPTDVDVCTLPRARGTL